jgi:hypothetical protein
MKFLSDRPYSDLEKAARKIVEIANATETVQDGRIYELTKVMPEETKVSPEEPKVMPEVLILRP